MGVGGAGAWPVVAGSRRRGGGGGGAVVEVLQVQFFDFALCVPSLRTTEMSSTLSMKCPCTPWTAGT